MSSKLANLATHGTGAFGSSTPAIEQGTLPLTVAPTNPLSDPIPEAPVAPAGVRSNRYAAKCVTCGHEVEANAGSLTRGPAGWETRHLPGQCSTEPTGDPETTATERVPEIVLQTGIYTLIEDGEHYTFRVTLQAPDADFAAGKTIIEYLSGSNNHSDYTSFAFVGRGPTLQVWRRFASDSRLTQAARRFLANPDAALESKTCLRCGDLLTNPASLAAGIGRTCAQAWGFPYT